MQQILRWMLVGLTLLVMSSCHDHNLAPTLSEHTLLIYISGDNSLSSLADMNIRSCAEGLVASEDPLNLVIYKDNYGNNGISGYEPSLFQLKVTSNHQVDTVYLKKWNKDLDSSDPDHFAEVVSMVFNKFDSNVKGLEIWGHGRSWIPGSTWNPTASSRAAQFANVDSLNYMEIWEMSDALTNTGIHLDYIMFDACFMGTAEVAYELRNNCDWLIGAPCEVPDKGFPYTNAIKSLCDVTGYPGESALALVNALKGCVISFGKRYPDRGALTLFNERQMEELHTAFKRHVADYASFYSEMADNPYLYESQMQHYGRSATGDRYHFYDIADFASISGGDLTPYISRAVSYHFAAPQYYDGAGTVTIDHSCGMAFTPAQLFSLSEQADRLSAAYNRIDWSR